MVQKLQHSIDYHNLLSNVIENELEQSNKPNNEVLWVQMINQLEIEGVKKIEISSIIRKDIEDKIYEKEYSNLIPRNEYHWHSGHFYRVMKKNGCGHIDSPEGEDNSSINTPNQDMKNLCDDVIDVCRTLKEKAAASEELYKIFGLKFMREFYKQRGTVMENCRNAIDEKTKVPKNTELFLLESLSTVLGNTHKCAEVFQDQIIKLMKDEGKFLTLKQATKFQRGGKQSQLPLLKPTSRDTAIFSGYWGIQCVCESWRVRLKENNHSMLECFDCEKTFSKEFISKCTHCQIPLYKERLQYMVKHNNKCESCQCENDLPQEIIESIKN